LHGQCLVSDGFEIKARTTDKAIPVQTGKFAIHTLGHVPTFATSLRHVCNAALNRPSMPSVCNAAVFVPSNAPS
jgi:hypothetical protein